MAANNPLFIADLATLKERLRLSGVPSSATDTQAIIDDCILRARLAIYRRLGALRINQLKAIPYVIDATTEDGIQRALANTIELDLVLVELFRRLPSAWMDGSGDLNKRWNEEAPFRERGSKDMEAWILRIQNGIEEDFQLLAGDEGFNSESGIKAFTIERTTAAPRPGSTLLTPIGNTLIDTPQDP